LNCTYTRNLKAEKTPQKFNMSLVTLFGTCQMQCTKFSYSYLFFPKIFTFLVWTTSGWKLRKDQRHHSSMNAVSLQAVPLTLVPHHQTSVLRELEQVGCCSSCSQARLPSVSFYHVAQDY
jgi:hypothetical protein